MATSESGQTYSNHARFYPLFHFFAAPILLANLLWALWQIVRAPSLVRSGARFVRPGWSED